MEEVRGHGKSRADWEQVGRLAKAFQWHLRRAREQHLFRGGLSQSQTSLAAVRKRRSRSGRFSVVPFPRQWPICRRSLTTGLPEETRVRPQNGYAPCTSRQDLQLLCEVPLPQDLRDGLPKDTAPPSVPPRWAKGRPTDAPPPVGPLLARAHWISGCCNRRNRENNDSSSSAVCFGAACAK
jgi:hypothetical protein